MQVVLALKVYRAKRGTYPDSLTDLDKYLNGASTAPEMRPFGPFGRLRTGKLGVTPSIAPGRIGAFRNRAWRDTVEGRRSRIQGWKLPLDPFSGKPFVYHRKSKGFVLYSFGDDLDDDGGRPYFGTNGDLVWEFKR